MKTLSWFFRPNEQPAWNDRGSVELDWLTQAFSGEGKHEGIDVGLAVQTPLYASGDGIVVDRQDGYGGGWGLHCVVDYGDDLSVRLAHMTRCDVQIGQLVQAGQRLGASGGLPGDPNAGSSTGPHTHAETRIGFVPRNRFERRVAVRGRPIDPLTVFTNRPPAAPAPTPQEIIAMPYAFTLPGTGQLWVHPSGQLAGIQSDTARNALMALGLLQKLPNGDDWLDVTDQFTADEIRRHIAHPVIVL